MEKELQSQEKNVRIFNFLIAACFLLYTSMMCAKSVFNAELVTFIDKMQTDKANASLANTYYYVTYAVVQVILAFFMDKLNVRLYLIITVPIAAISGMLVAFAANIEQVWALFAVQGVFQAGIYAGCMYVLSLYLPSDMVSKGNAVMQAGFAIGNTIAYVVAALFVALDLWTVPYVLFGVMFLGSTAFFAAVTAKIKRLYPDAENKRKTLSKELKDTRDHDSELSYNNGLFTLGTKKRVFWFYFWSVAYSVFATTAYYAINNWVANFIKEIYGFSDSISIVISIVVPIMTFFGPAIAIAVSQKHKDYIKAAFITSFIPLGVSVFLIFIYGLNVVVAILFVSAFIVSTRTLTGFQSVATFDMRTQINTGSYTAMINAAASISAGVAPTIIGKMIDSAKTALPNGNGEWAVMFINAAAVSAATLVFLAVAYFLTKNKNNLNNQKLK